MTKENIIGALAVLAFIGVVFLLATRTPATDFGAATAPTSMLIEGYVPVVQYNGGIKTALPIAMTSAATTTLFVKSTATAQGWCTEFNATSTNTLVNMVFAASSTAPSTVGGLIPVITYGACN